MRKLSLAMIKQLAIRLGYQNTKAKSLVIAVLFRTVSVARSSPPCLAFEIELEWFGCKGRSLPQAT